MRRLRLDISEITQRGWVLVRIQSAVAKKESVLFFKDVARCESERFNVNYCSATAAKRLHGRWVISLNFHE